jgi:CDP-diglyceride synthetase
MYNIVDDRIFWIYVIITLFFIIIGIGLIISSNDPNLIAINILWLISMLALMVSAYYIYNDNDDYFKIFIIIIFISLLIISVLWTGELWNKNDNQLLIIFSVLILLGGLILFNLRIESDDINTVSYWSLLLFIAIWLSLILFTIE